LGEGEFVFFLHFVSSSSSLAPKLGCLWNLIFFFLVFFFLFFFFLVVVFFFFVFFRSSFLYLLPLHPLVVPCKSLVFSHDESNIIVDKQP
jgi:hypothetical protein